MLTFSVAEQTVQVGEQSLTFGVDPHDTSLVSLKIDDWVVMFKRNGDLISCLEETDDGGEQSEGHLPARGDDGQSSEWQGADAEGGSG